jgi:proteasome alpha subunit
MKPMEVEILVAEIGDEAGDEQLFHVLYDGSVVDETDLTVLGGEAEVILERLKASYRPGLSLADALKAAIGALAEQGKTLQATDLEVAVLSRSNGRRAFRRLEDEELAALLS